MGQIKYEAGASSAVVKGSIPLLKIVDRFPYRRFPRQWKMLLTNVKSCVRFCSSFEIVMGRSSILITGSCCLHLDLQ